MTKRNPLNQKFIHLQKYRFHARKVEDSKHAIYDVCERVWCCLTESRPPAVRRPGPSQIKMMSFADYFARCQWHIWPTFPLNLFMQFSQKVLILFVNTMVQKSQKWPKTQIQRVLRASWPSKWPPQFYTHRRWCWYEHVAAWHESQ